MSLPVSQLGFDFCFLYIRIQRLKTETSPAIKRKTSRLFFFILSLFCYVYFISITNPVGRRMAIAFLSRKYYRGDTSRESLRYEGLLKRREKCNEEGEWKNIWFLAEGTMINGRKTESYIYDKKKKKIRNEWKKEKAFWGKERGMHRGGAVGGWKRLVVTHAKFGVYKCL